MGSKTVGFGWRGQSLRCPVLATHVRAIEDSDPATLTHHNTVKDFYLVNGDLSGSWEGLPKETIIMNWNSGKAAPSLKQFAAQGHSQVLAGYYDAPPERIRNWLDTGKGLPKNFRGAMYTTWQGNFTDLEKFAMAAWGGAK